MQPELLRHNPLPRFRDSTFIRHPHFPPEGYLNGQGVGWRDVSGPDSACQGRKLPGGQSMLLQGRMADTPPPADDEPF